MVRDMWTTCPLCRKPVLRDIKGEDPESVWMDGWHHKYCLDQYFLGNINLPLYEEDDDVL